MKTFIYEMLLLFLITIVSPIEAFITCGAFECYGWSSYCCGSFEDQCCIFSVYQFWWFWFIWISFFCLIVSCSCWCYRRRRYGSQHFAVRQCPPSYGTVVVPAPPVYPSQQYQIGATAPPTYQEKPPAYIP